MLRLRPYKKCDAEKILSWIEDEETFRLWSANIYESYPITAEDIHARYTSFDSSDNFYPMTAFDDTGAVGHLTMQFTDEEKKTLYFGVIIVDGQKRGKGYGKALVELAVAYGFQMLGAETIQLDVFARNTPAVQCYRSVGFREVPAEKPAYLNLMGQDWLGLRMEITKKS